MGVTVGVAVFVGVGVGVMVDPIIWLRIAGRSPGTNLFHDSHGRKKQGTEGRGVGSLEGHFRGRQCCTDQSRVRAESSVRKTMQPTLYNAGLDLDYDAAQFRQPILVGRNRSNQNRCAGVLSLIHI